MFFFFFIFIIDHFRFPLLTCMETSLLWHRIYLDFIEDFTRCKHTNTSLESTAISCDFLLHSSLCNQIILCVDASTIILFPFAIFYFAFISQVSILSQYLWIHLLITLSRSLRIIGYQVYAWGYRIIRPLLKMSSIS